MVPILLQSLALIAAGFALFALWRTSASHSRLIGLLVAGGILARVGLGVVLFWVSWLGLPYGRSLQLGNGFWFYATDGTSYFARGVAAIADGPGGILTMSRYSPSIFFNQALALFLWLFGSIASVGVFLNLFSYVGSVVLIVRWARARAVSDKVLALPIVAIGFSPSWLLWATQPLKDAFFCFLVVAFALTLDRWVQAWRSDSRSPLRLAGIAALLLFLQYGVAGIRWYYAFVAMIMAAWPLLSAVSARGTMASRSGAAAVAVFLVFALSRQILWGAGPYLPEQMNDVLRFRSRDSVAVVANTLEKSRLALDYYVDAGTRIRTGTAMRDTSQPATTAGANPPAPAAASPAQPAASVTQPSVPATQTVAATQASAPETESVVAAAQTSAPAAQTSAPSTEPAAPATQPVPATQPAAATKTPAPAPPAATPAATNTAVAASPAQPAAVPAAAAPSSETSVLAQSEEAAGPQSDVPVTMSGRLIAGFSAMLLPHFIAERLGLISVGEGRGFWWFADFDTLLFDVFVVAALVLTLRRWKNLFREPAAMYLAGVSAAMAGALAYTISNFGVLFRHRSMVLNVVVLLPIAVYRARREAEEADGVPEPLPDEARAPAVEGESPATQLAEERSH